ncbi:MAG: hypothetical protein U9Q92_05365 [archaeon]|nr:hypothetical protein [archaeon]
MSSVLFVVVTVEFVGRFIVSAGAVVSFIYTYCVWLMFPAKSSAYASMVFVPSARLVMGMVAEVTFAEPLAEYFTDAMPVPVSVALSVASVFVV